jgi:hypothetical protein
MCILLYSHSEYNFLWKATIPLLQRYAANIKIYFCCNDTSGYTLPDQWKVHIYDPTTLWPERVKGCVDIISERYILYIQEDWLLIDTIQPHVISYLLQFMEDTGCEYLSNHIRELHPEKPILSQIPSYVFQRCIGHYFQPSLWSKSLLYKVLMAKYPPATYASLNIDNESGEPLRLTQESICYCIINHSFPNDITTRSLFFPHMHAIFRGRWTFMKYPTLKALVESYGIDTSTRGIDTEWIIYTQ